MIPTFRSKACKLVDIYMKHVYKQRIQCISTIQAVRLNKAYDIHLPKNSVQLTINKWNAYQQRVKYISTT